MIFNILSLQTIDSRDFYGHMVHIEGDFRYIFISSGLLSPLLVVVSIPVYLYYIAILYHIPGMLNRLMILSLMIAFTIIMDMKKVITDACLTIAMMSLSLMSLLLLIPKIFISSSFNISCQYYLTSCLILLSWSSSVPRVLIP